MNVWIPLALLVFVIVTVFIRMKTRAKERIREIGLSEDIEALAAVAGSESGAEFRDAAARRLIELGRTTEDPDVFVRIARKTENDAALYENFTGRFSPETILLEIRPEIGVSDEITEPALEQIRDEKILAEIFAKNTYAENIRLKALERITDRDLLYSLAVSFPERRDLVSRLDAEQLRGFGMDCCRNGHHDWETETEDTTNEELDIRSYIMVRRCRRCGRTVVKDHDDVYGTTEEVTVPGLFGK